MRYNLRQEAKRSHPCSAATLPRPWQMRASHLAPQTQRLVIVHIVMPTLRHRWLRVLWHLSNERLSGE